MSRAPRPLGHGEVAALVHERVHTVMRSIPSIDRSALVSDCWLSLRRHMISNDGRYPTRGEAMMVLDRVAALHADRAHHIEMSYY